MGLTNVLTLLLTRKISRKGVRYIVQRAGKFDATMNSTNGLLALIEEEKLKYPQMKLPNREDVLKAAITSERIIERSQKLDIKILAFNDINFPHRFNNIPDPPVVVFAKGNIELLNAKSSVAIVGTRNPTEYGIQEGFKLSKIFAENGFVIVSGLAIGCDTLAHKGCLAANGKTVAIFAGGIDYVYPKVNEPLANEILSKEGCLLSEYEVGRRPMRHHFIERDRLQSGLSKAVIVIETGLSGGTIHTIGYAKKQGRALACLANHPENLLDHLEIQGNKKFIFEGIATKLGSTEEINNFIKILQTKEVNQLDQISIDLTKIEGGVQGTLF